MLFVATGGTIDKQPAFLSDGTTFDNDTKLFGKTQLPEMLKETGIDLRGSHPILTLFMVDSLDMTDGHRGLIGAAIAGSEHEQVIITHGTDTMSETARALSLRSTLASKTIILTGSMIPYSMGETSDAVPNLRDALTYAQTLSPGVYVAMNGQAFDANNVRKDREAGVFKTLE